MLRVDVAMQEKYGKLGLADLLKKNKHIKGKDGLPILSAALGILEKYGRNLLKSNRPSQWKTISFSNAVFRTRVGIIKGARDVLNLLGYTEVVEDGVCFPEDMQAPNTNTVAVVTADLILAKLEIEAFLKKTHPNRDRVTECLEGTIAAIRYPPSGVNDPEGGTVYVRRTSQPSLNSNNRAIEPASEEQLSRPAIPVAQSSRPAISVAQSSYQPTQSSSGSSKPPFAPKPAWVQNSAASGGRPSTSEVPSTETSNDHLVCSMCGQDSATKSCNSCPDRFRCEQCDTKWHGHPNRAYHTRQDVYPTIQAPSMPSGAPEETGSSSPPKMCSVCGGQRATQYCQQCDAVSCDVCATKMHQHPKRKTHKLQPLPGGGSSRRQSPEGRSIRIPTGDSQERTDPAGQSDHQPSVKRPDNFNNQQMPFIPNQQQQPNRQLPELPGDGAGSQQKSPDLAAQGAVAGERKRPVPKPRKNIKSPTVARPDHGGLMQGPTASLSTNIGYEHPNDATSPTSSSDPRKEEIASIMSRDVNLLERISSLRNSLKSLPRNQPQYNSLMQMENSLWDEHKELMQRQAELEKSLQEPTIPIQRGYSMNVDIRRPPIADKPLTVIPDESEPQPPSVNNTSTPYGQSQSTRRPQDATLPRPPAEGWECNSCGFLNDGNSLRCEDCDSAYSGNQVQTQHGMQRPHLGMNQNQETLYQNQPMYPIKTSEVQSQRPHIGVNQSQAMLYQNQPTYAVKQPDMSHSSQAPPVVQSRSQVSNIISAFDTGPGQPSPTVQQPIPQQSPTRKAAQQAKILEAQLPGGMPFGIKTPASKTKEWVCQFCTFLNDMDISVCQMCNERREARETSTVSSQLQSPKTPVQRQQTEGDKRVVKDEDSMTAYEYMQVEEERMLQEKREAKSLDQAHQSMGSKYQAPDVVTKPPKTVLQAGAMPTMPPPNTALQAGAMPTMPPPNTTLQAGAMPTMPPPNTALQAGAMPIKPPVIKRMKGARLEPLSGAMEKLTLNEGDVDRLSLSTSPGREFGEDRLSLSHTAHLQERRQLAEQATEGLAFINILRVTGFYRASETNGFCVEDVTVASQVILESQSTEEVVPWLQQYWDDFKSTATAQATNALNVSGRGQRIRLSEEEVVDALYKHEGKMEQVVHECIEQRRQKIMELESYGFENSQAAKAISMSDGNVDKALMKLQEEAVGSFYERLWEKDEEDKELLERLKVVPADEDAEHEVRWGPRGGRGGSQTAKAISMSGGNVDKALMKLQEEAVGSFYERLWEKDEEDKELLERLKVVPADEDAEHERYLRLLLAEFGIGSWGRTRTAARLIAAEKYAINDAITAASECGDYERAKQFLEKECHVCFGEFPHNQLMSLSHCTGCLICSECLADHFKIVIQQRNIIHATCPACNRPDAKDVTELAEYFTFLDSLLRTLLDEETHSLFQHKLRDWNLQKEENFRWCAHCRNGFINEAPERRKMRCPECGKITCFNCKKPWMDQHENITCQEFEQWKQDNDPERQAEGVAYHLKENGIACPQCKMRYELAKGGCMHFKCTQCMFEFCCGCNKPFEQGNECGKFPSCANRGLHSHHPRDCLFHLRDWDVKQLQKLLDNHRIKYDVKPPQGQEGQQRGCRVMEQKETPEGLNDGTCGREAIGGHAGLCKIHYTEYLVGLINQNLIDPGETYDCNELTIVLKRNEIAVPARVGGEPEQLYKKRLLTEVQQKLAFQGKPPRERP
ncbi:LOW QUALITY PROTEIN: uncharacterized protein [Amphiura filiformis]|uniref:LOW QUALITY PROTEIN: uncharacterized protein n=1 Tax=Amphiura filiformis TaxID=82378 RepID=UPI003B226735